MSASEAAAVTNARTVDSRSSKKSLNMSLTLPTSQFDEEFYSHATSPASTSSGFSFCDDVYPDSLTLPTIGKDGSLPDSRDESEGEDEQHSEVPVTDELETMMAEDMDDIDLLSDDGFVVLEGGSQTTDDDRETASLASTERAESDGGRVMTPVEFEDDGYFDDINAGSVGDLAGTLGYGGGQSLTEADKERKEQERIKQTEQDNELMDSIMNDDLETPRQSTIRLSTAKTEDPSSPTASPTETTTAKKSIIVSIRVLLYTSPHLGTLAIASEIAARVAIGLCGGTESFCEFTQLPPTPDNGDGALLCRYKNLEITVDRTGPIKYEQNMMAASPPNPPDLVVTYLSRMGEFPHAFVYAATLRGREGIPLVVITKDTENICLRDHFRSATPALLLDEEDFFESTEDTSKGLKNLLKEKLISRGLKSIGARKKKLKKSKEGSLWTWLKRSMPLMQVALSVLILAIIMPMLFTSYDFLHNTRSTNLKYQRETLSASLSDWINMTGIDASEVVPHLLKDDSEQKAIYTVIEPNQVVLAMSGDYGFSGARVAGTEVSRVDDDAINFNFTYLTSHAYGITLPREEAYGLVLVNVTFARPAKNVEIFHNFGNRVWQRQTYEKATTDLANSINKDVAVARKAARSLTDRVGLEVFAGVAATRNVTTQLAVRVGRDVQVFASNAFEVFGNAAAQSVGNVKQIPKELMEMRKDVIERVDDVKKSIATTAHSIKDLIVPSKKSIASPLGTSRKRALSFKKVVTGDEQKPGKPKRGLRDRFGCLNKKRAEGGVGEEKSKCAKCKQQKKCEKSCQR